MPPGLHAFRGAERRFQYKGEYHGAMIYDDYAHHPGELHALLDTVRTLGYERIICAFQPHTYTRTKALFGDFVRGAGPSRHHPAGGDLRRPGEEHAGHLLQGSGRAHSRRGILRHAGRRDSAACEELAQPGDLILTVGAGDIYTVGEAMVKDAESETQNS